MAIASQAWGQASDGGATDPGAPNTVEFSDLSLEDLLNTPTSVASQRAQTVRDTPGAVTIINRDEIIAAGARDLIDVLLLVPGFSFPGVDVENVVDFGFRGLWAHEGKILLMVDGQPFPDLFYGNNALGHHFPIEQIQSVEIIRGPGSAIYGGSAELAVINIITRSASDLHGAAASVYYGQMPKALGQRDLNLAIGQANIGKISGLNFTGAMLIGEGNRSDSNYTDFSGNSFPMTGNSGTQPKFFNLGLQFRDLHLRFIYDRYHLTERDSYGNDNETTSLVPQPNPAPASEYWTTLFADASYDFKLGRLTLTPRFNYKRQNTFQVTDQTSFDYSDHVAERYTARLAAAYDFNDNFNAMLGAEYFLDRAWENTPVLATGAPNNLIGTSPRASFSNIATFGEAEYRGIIGNLTLGARYEHHSFYGESFVPRSALTKTIGDFHFKLLYSFAFRAPGIGDIGLANPNGITPEHARVGEVELGYSIGEHMLFTGNFFDIVIQDPLVFQSNVIANTYYYFNFPRTGSQGFELEYRLRYNWGFVKANYSYYSSWSIFADAAKNNVPYYTVPDNAGLLLGFPAHKVTVSGKFIVWRNLSVAPSVLYFSPRYGSLTGDGAGNGIGAYTPPLVLINAFVSYNDLFTRGLEVGIGVYNLLNSGYGYIQPYDSGHAPLPGPRRDIVGRIAYNFDFAL